MTTHRPRGASPPASRRFADPRFPTSQPPVFASSFDPRYSQYPRGSVDTFAPPRNVADRPYDAQPVKRRTYADSGYPGSTKTRTEYAVRPRHNSTTADEARRPMSVLGPAGSPTRNRPLVNNAGRDRPRSPLPASHYAHDDSERMIYPAASRLNHQRHNSATPTDMDRLGVNDRDRRERGAYRSSRGYPASGALVRYQDEDAYSYTGPREQFDRDFPTQPRPERDNYSRRERPTSVIEPVDRRLPVQPRRDPGPPPSANRQFDRIGKSDGFRSEVRPGASNDTERDIDIPTRRHSLRAPVSLHQDRENDYSSQRDDHGDRREPRPRRDRQDEDNAYYSDRDHRAPNHHEDRHTKRRDRSLDRSDMGTGLAAVGLGGLAAAGLSGARSKETRDSDHDAERDVGRDRRHRRRREKEPNKDEIIEDELKPEQLRDRPYEYPVQREPRDLRRDDPGRDRVDSDSLEEQPSRRRHRRRGHREREGHSPEANSGSGSDTRNSAATPRESVRREEEEEGSEQDDSDRRRNDRRHRHASDQTVSETEGFSGAPGGDEDGRPRRVLLVEPPKEKEQGARPKGILKPARQVPFPEDPNPTREGVAPLKEAQKKGIPTGARWTKINRKLVNPAALEAVHERFEERDDYVIVLRVLTREEIEKFAELTREIRGKRSNGLRK